MNTNYSIIRVWVCVRCTELLYTSVWCLYWSFPATRHIHLEKLKRIKSAEFWFNDIKCTLANLFCVYSHHWHICCTHNLVDRSKNEVLYTVYKPPDLELAHKLGKQKEMTFHLHKMMFVCVMCVCCKVQCARALYARTHSILNGRRACFFPSLLFILAPFSIGIDLKSYWIFPFSKFHSLKTSSTDLYLLFPP